MTLETWMESRKLILLTEKRNHLFDTLPTSPNFNRKRKELYTVLSRIEQYQRDQRVPVAAPTPLGITMVA